MGSKTNELIVIIDDSEMDIFLLKHLLGNLKLAKKIETFSNALHAYHYFHQLVKEKSAFPELIFLDINMPEMTGFEFLKAFKSLPSSNTRKTKFILVSSSDAEEDIKKSGRYREVIRYLIKPVSKLDFIDLDQNAEESKKT